MGEGKYMYTLIALTAHVLSQSMDVIYGRAGGDVCDEECKWRYLYDS